ncbi:hypothetical protein MPSEU_001022800 [Mayamaea pseudoterrestris]|nr:hypothetical protein MPSEU_001022800 [Mayamaea pseudoterrestris]
MRNGPKGRGLFAVTDAIPPGALIHIAPTIPVSSAEYNDHMRHTVLEHYLFKEKRSGGMLLALGYGSLFNHSKLPNIDYRIHYEPDGSCTIRYYSSVYRSISKGDELCISYGSDLWFDDASVDSGLEEDVVVGAANDDSGIDTAFAADFLTQICLPVDDGHNDT